MHGKSVKMSLSRHGGFSWTRTTRQDHQRVVTRHDRIPVPEPVAEAITIPAVIIGDGSRVPTTLLRFRAPHRPEVRREDRVVRVRVVRRALPVPQGMQVSKVVQACREAQASRVVHSRIKARSAPAIQGLWPPVPRDKALRVHPLVRMRVNKDLHRMPRKARTDRSIAANVLPVRAMVE
jgi:hypothetical protein